MMDEDKLWEEIRVLRQDVRKLSYLRRERESVDLLSLFDLWCERAYMRQNLFNQFLSDHQGMKPKEMYARYNEVRYDGISNTRSSITTKSNWFGFTKGFVLRRLRLGELIQDYVRMREYESLVIHGLPKGVLMLEEKIT